MGSIPISSTTFLSVIEPLALATLASALFYPVVGTAVDRLRSRRLAAIGIPIAAGESFGLAMASTIWTIGGFVVVLAVGAAVTLVPSSLLAAELAEPMQSPAYTSTTWRTRRGSPSARRRSRLNALKADGVLANNSYTCFGLTFLSLCVSAAKNAVHQKRSITGVSS